MILYSRESFRKWRGSLLDQKARFILPLVTLILLWDHQRHRFDLYRQLKILGILGQVIKESGLRHKCRQRKRLRQTRTYLLSNWKSKKRLSRRQALSLDPYQAPSLRNLDRPRCCLEIAAKLLQGPPLRWFPRQLPKLGALLRTSHKTHKRYLALRQFRTGG